ncbi:hypothetical protein CCU68_28855 [Pseudomonas gingeri NCPPB 3146 = LMG 5327]|uniref:Uncharacterized protein n=2 Tax=Pseudomonas gingeri TaxID=117681 RepID=A0A7Y8CFW6_9PSED|nr:hypothetical protein [Pseudomonas gingeri]NWC17339.1 hypothetical protein [Pseudomonas gingeri]PNQ89110.1 hypothetical protein CCU68_28855 [Pseudomonas gingeri NCPPB 3146 = LMG 5327]
MSLYEIVFSGELVPGAPVEQVRSNLARLFQADAQRIELLFSGRRLVLKNNLDAAAAEKYRATIERAGAVVSVLEMPMEEIEMTAAPEPVGRARVVPRDAYMAAFSEVDAPDYAIAEVGSDVQDPKPAPVAPVLDLSAFSVAPVGSDMGQLPAPPPAAVPDTSHLKLS